MAYLSYVAVAIAAYFLGSVPTGYLVARAKGIDIRTVGSGNIGATNVFRILGRPAGVLVLGADALKGFVAVATIVNGYPQLHGWFPQFFSTGAGGHSDDQLRENLGIVAGIFAVFGHNFPCWLNFKGGKGIATSAGVLVALVPWALLVILAIWIVVFALTRYVSLGSIAASFALPFAAWLTGSSLTLVLITAGLGVLAIYKHKGNIHRLLNGSESRVSFKRKPSPS
ncbi:MAG TPA: glycerol-3-phosphate 1-O-acyltransferase PlsY [Verrucomicrobiae bacterium]|nr:glycerol-3-phosphate 1-O-acyltransferase PlsY [Verrucomicrobiae bacterium]